MNDWERKKIIALWEKLVVFGYIDTPIDPRTIVLDFDTPLKHDHQFRCQFTARKKFRGGIKYELTISLWGTDRDIGFAIVRTDETLRNYFKQYGIPLNYKTGMIFALLHEVGHLDGYLRHHLAGEKSYKEYRRLQKEEQRTYKQLIKNVTTRKEADRIYRQMSTEMFCDYYALNRLRVIVQDSRFSIEEYWY